MVAKTVRLIGINLLVLLVLLGTIEFATRMMSWVRGDGFMLALEEIDPFHPDLQQIYQWHPFVGFTYVKSREMQAGHPRQDFKSNLLVDEHGFLASETGLGYAKPEGEIRIATIGGSTTASANLNYNQNWPGLLGARLQKEYPDKTIRIINAGIPGFDTSQSIGNLALRVMPFSPDVVIIYHAYNDLKAIRKDKDFLPDYSHSHDTPYGFHKAPGFLQQILNRSMVYVRGRAKEDKAVNKLKIIEFLRNPLQTENRYSSVPAIAQQSYLQHMQSLVGIARMGGAQVILSSFATLNDPDLDYHDTKTYESMSERQIRELGQLTYFTEGLTIDAIFSGLAIYNQINQSVAMAGGGGFVDSARLIAHTDENFVDRVHFSAAGAARMAENLFPELVRVLKQSGKI